MIRTKLNLEEKIVEKRNNPIKTMANFKVRGEEGYLKYHLKRMV